jgi:hypothetical protein
VKPSPHVLDFQAALIAAVKPFDTFPIHPASIAVFHLGNNGTARTQLKTWPVPN